MSRIVCQFSCGAASAVATKLAIAQYGLAQEVVIVNAFVQEEDEDNRRFLADCEKWFGQPVVQLRDEKYGASTREVFRKVRYIKGRRGATCSARLKKEVLNAFAAPDDTFVLGYTSDEQWRLDGFIDANGSRRVIAPLIDNGLGKADVLAMVQRAGIELPRMYRLGYHNANCVGCVKGGEGYWNKIRVDFPEVFEEMAQIEETIGPGAYLFRNRKTKVRFSLRQLDPKSGRYQDEPDISCSGSCELVENSGLWAELREEE